MGLSKKNLDLFDPTLSPGFIIWALAWPTIVEQILQVTVTFADSAMVGALGEGATAAISVTSSTIWLVNGWMNALALGFGVLMARHLGAGKRDRAKLVVRQALITALAFGLFLSLLFMQVARFLPAWIGAEEAVRPLSQQYLSIIALGYIPNLLMITISTLLRLSGDTKRPLYLNAFNNVANILGNLFFIFPSIRLGSLVLPGLGLGVGGAAMATTLACTLTAILLVAVLFKGEHKIQISFKDRWSFDATIQKQALRLGVPIALERSTLSFGQIALTKMVGTLGTTALAAHFLAISAESITYLPASGFSTAATTLVAQSLGRDDKALAKRYANLCVLWGTLMMSFMGLVLYLFAPQLMNLFTQVDAVIVLGAQVLQIEAFAQPAFGLSILVFGVMRGGGDTKAPFLISLAGMWLLRLPFAFLLLKLTSLGLAAVWIAMMSDLMLRGFICLYSYRKGTWLTSWKQPH
ncbi:MAG TPA: MATE family efflux transporter [Sphaerochaeta sp.]|nr:MATE family efflux transporter [Sphaerochaeta sp.]